MNKDLSETSQPTYEEAFSKLEALVRKLEAGDVKLDEALQLFEEGVALTRLCSSLLDRAEARINVLTTNDEGEPLIKPFESDTPGAAS